LYGDRIRGLPADEPAWIVDTPDNHAVIQSIWREREGQNVLEGIASFPFDASAGHEDWLIAELGVIDLHHGEFSHNPPYSILNVIGVQWSERIQRELNSLGFDKYEATSEGFTCMRDTAVLDSEDCG
jgi:hypothetical protein